MNGETISEKELRDQIAQGRVALVGEYRQFGKEQVKYRSKRDGSYRELTAMRHTVETTGDTVVVSEFAKDGVDVNTIKEPAQRGQRVAVMLTALKTEKGQRTAMGTIKVLTAKAA